MQEGRHIPEIVAVTQTNLENMIVVGLHKLVLKVFEEKLLFELIIAAYLDE